MISLNKLYWYAGAYWQCLSCMIDPWWLSVHSRPFSTVPFGTQPWRFLLAHSPCNHWASPVVASKTHACLLPIALPFREVTKERRTSRRPSPFTSANSNGDRSPPDKHIKNKKKSWVKSPQNSSLLQVRKGTDTWHCQHLHKNQADSWFLNKIEYTQFCLFL